jgi:hypothetical protein
MRRLLILLFAIMLPLQFTWASAAAFCEHGREHQRQMETGAAPAWHFGHHMHEHDAGAHGKTGTKLPDADCAICHFAGSHVMLPAATQPASYHFITLRYRVLPVNYGSVPARAPDRPQWPRLA